MGRTREVIKDRAYDPDKIVTDQTLTDHLSMKAPPGRKAYSLLLFMLKQEPGLLDHDRNYTFTLSDLRTDHKRTKIKELEQQLDQLTATRIFWHDTKAKRMVFGHIVDTAIADYGHDGLLTITLKIGPLFRSYMNKSRLYSLLDRAVIESFSSRYSLFLYQRLAGIQGYTRTHSITWTPEQLRKVLCVPDKKLKRGNDLMQRALEPAIADINAHAPFTVSYTTSKASRRIAKVTISWNPKPGIEIKPTDLKPSSLDNWPKIKDEQLNYYKIEPSKWDDLRPKFRHWIRANGHQITPTANDRNLEDFLEEIAAYSQP